MDQSDILFTSILNKDRDCANANLLRIGDLTMLLDCGCDELYSKANLDAIVEALDTFHVDYIFLSHSALTNVGALPYLQIMGKLDQLKVMSTSPTAKMGALTMYEYFIQKKEIGNFEYFTLPDVEKVFEKIELVSFNENRKLKVHETEIIISALPNGSYIGGTCWKIEYNKQVIIYALDLNDSQLNITVPMKFEEFKSSNIIITNAYQIPKVLKNNSMLTTSKTYKYVSQEKLRLKIEKVLVDNGGQILIPMSDKNRILQTLITLEHMFMNNTKLQTGLRNYNSPPVIYLEHMSRDTLGVGRSHLGWMNFQDNKVFQDIDENPINFQYVKDIFTMEEYRQLEDGPRVIVTSLASFEQGYTQQLIQDFSFKTKNEILFLQKFTFFKKCLGKKLMEGEKEFKITESAILANLDEDMSDTTLNRRESELSSSHSRRPIDFTSTTMEVDTDLLSHQVLNLDQDQLTFAQNQLRQSRENYLYKVNDKLYRQNFQHGSYAMFSQQPLDSMKKLTFYGMGTDEQNQDVEINQEVEEVQQAINNVFKEQGQIQNYNRFKDLQKRYGKQFLYHNQESQFKVNCKVSYIPFEARIQRISFELLIRESKPKELILVNCSKRKIDKVEEFINYNQLPTNLHQALGNKNITFQTNAAVKQIFLEDVLYKSLPIQRVHRKYEIARVKGAIELLQEQEGGDQISIFDTLRSIPLLTETERSREQFEKKNLFFRSKDYKLSDLKHFLETQNMPTVLVDKCLNYDDKIYIYFDEVGQIRLEGVICKEYFAIRTMIYQHFGRV